MKNDTVTGIEISYRGALASRIDLRIDEPSGEMLGGLKALMGEPVAILAKSHDVARTTIINLTDFCGDVSLIQKAIDYASLKLRNEAITNAARRVVETFEFDTAECAMRPEGMCDMCKAIHNLRAALVNRKGKNAKVKS